MKQAIFLLCCMLMLAGCRVYTFTTTDKKIPTRPYSRLMAIYLDEACDFTLFDSTTYNICLKSCFIKTDNWKLRSRVENLLADKIRTGGTAVESSSMILDSVTNSYSDFKKALADGNYDAFLLVIFRKDSKKIYFNGEASRQGRGDVYQKSVPGFHCYLFNTTNGSFPIWTARLELGDPTYSAQQGINGKMANDIAKSLRTIGYIAH